MRSPAHCTPCNPSVGAGVLDGPTRIFSAPGRAHGPCPTRSCVIGGRADRVVRPYKPFRRAGCPHPAAGLAPHSLQKPCHCETSDRCHWLWQSVLLVLGTEVLRIPTTSLRTGLGMTRKFFRLLSLLWQSVPPPPKILFPSRKKGPRHPAEPLFKPIQFIRNPHCPPCAGAAPHPGCCSLP